MSSSPDGTSVEKSTLTVEKTVETVKAEKKEENELYPEEEILEGDWMRPQVCLSS